MIKNAVVLLDEINQNIRAGKDRLTATIDSALSRLRPVMMASLTTILGMAPLLCRFLHRSNYDHQCGRGQCVLNASSGCHACERLRPLLAWIFDIDPSAAARIGLQRVGSS